MFIYFQVFNGAVLFRILLCILNYLLCEHEYYIVVFYRLTRKYSFRNYSSSSLELNYDTAFNTSSDYVKEDSDIDFSENYGLFEDGKSEFCLRFKFPTYEEFSRSKYERCNFISFENKPSSSSSKYEFTPTKSISGFVEEIEPDRFKVERVSADINGCSFGNSEVKEDELLFDGIFSSFYVETESDHKEIQKDSAVDLSVERVIKENDALEVTRDGGKSINEKGKFDACDAKEESLSMDNGFLEAFNTKDVHSIESHLVNSCKNGFLSDGEFGGTFVLDHMIDLDERKEESDKNMTESDEESQESEDLGEEDNDIVEELKILEEESLQTSHKFKYNFLSEKHFGEQSANKIGESSGKQDQNNIKGSGEFTIPELKNDSVMDSDQDSNKLETLWEHQDLIDQLKMELKKVRATGLPTILEESESPKIMEDLKPWKFDDKFHHDNPMGELHKFYKSFRERMRKFDILNYQKMYAIGQSPVIFPTICLVFFFSFSFP